MVEHLRNTHTVLTSVFSRLRVFDSGVMVIELQTHKEEEMVASALETVCESRFLQPLELATKTQMHSDLRSRIRCWI